MSVGIKLLASCLSASGAMAPASASLGPPCCFGATSHAMVVLERETQSNGRQKKKKKKNKLFSFHLFEALDSCVLDVYVYMGVTNCSQGAICDP